MDYGAHLPLIAFDDRPLSLERLCSFAEAAEGLGFKAVTANDHLVFSRPWLDGPMALAAVLSATRRIGLATSVALPVVRGPVALAKALGAIDLLSGGRLEVGVGPGSSARDYAAVGLSFEERWKRLDEAVLALRALWRKGGDPMVGNFYSTEGLELEPYPAQDGGPPIWIGSWGSGAGLRRVARLADGWLASGYNTTPELFSQAWADLKVYLGNVGKDPDRFPNAIATMWCYVTEDRDEAERILNRILAPMLNRPAEQLRPLLLIGPADECAEKLSAYQRAGAQRVFIWPIEDEVNQLSVFMERVAPQVGA